MTRRSLQRRLFASGVALLLAYLVFGRAEAQKAPALPPPAAWDDPTLPRIPTESARNANYTIEASLDPAQHTLTGTLTLEWRNITQKAVSNFPVHLYWNAFENTLSTNAREAEEGSTRAQNSTKDRRFGYTHVQDFSLLGQPDTDLMPTFRYIHPDDDNGDDHTVAEVETPQPVPPGSTARFKIVWAAKIPYGDKVRSGWVNDYHFMAQWFPKIGVLQEKGWNCHQFHANTEFFSDYGVYDVHLRVPEAFRVGATGRLLDERPNGDGTKTLHFHEDDVHDFTWTASPRFLEREGRFDEAGYPPVDIRLLLQPEHASLSDRYIAATKIALRSYGTWAAPYPYGHVTVVDPAWNSGSGGMEYPTLFTGGARLFSPPSLQSPEVVTIHEAGHQFWYGLVGNNEFEEAWLDEGFNTYHERKATAAALGAQSFSHRYFGLGRRRGLPSIPDGVFLSGRDEEIESLRQDGTVDAMAREGWRYRTRDSYGLNSYDKPGLTLETLEGLVGDATMTRIMRTYARQYRFKHPTTRDFIETVNTVTGKDYTWFFNETFFSSDICDYAVVVKNTEVKKAIGFSEAPGALPHLIQKSQAPSPRKDYDSEVTVLREGGVRLPVELLVEFVDGQQVHETWDGAYRWERFSYHKKVRRAVVDPDNKIALDVDPSNNSWVDETPEAPRAALKWSARWMFWLQNLFELETLFS